MRIFCDTSAIYAHLNSDDQYHSRVEALWPRLLAEHSLVTTNYVLLETHALVQNRLGQEAARDLQEAIRPLLAVVWVDQELEDAAIEYCLAANRRELSLVDCVSFIVMRRLKVRHAVSFDKHFAERGYSLPQ